MIKNNKELITDWDALYMAYNKEIGEDIFEKYCADEWPLIYMLEDLKDETDIFEYIVEFFYEHYEALWHNNVTGESEEVEPESPEWYEGEKQHKTFILTLANYFKNRRIEELLNNVIEIASQYRIKITPSNILEN